MGGLEVGGGPEVQRQRSVLADQVGLPDHHVAERKGGVAVVAFLVVLREEGGLGGGSVEGVVSFLVGQFAADVHHRHPLAAVDPVPERQDVVVTKELVAVVFGSLELFADVVLEEPRSDGLVDLVDLPGCSASELRVGGSEARESIGLCSRIDSGTRSHQMVRFPDEKRRGSSIRSCRTTVLAGAGLETSGVQPAIARLAKRLAIVEALSLRALPSFCSG